MLGRIMGLQHAHLLPHDMSVDEALERTKVLRSLYARDKSLCATRGCVSWLPSDDCSIASQLGTTMEDEAPFADRFRLAVIQDELYRLTNADSRRRSSSTSKLQGAVQRIEQQLDEYARSFGIFNPEASYSPCHALVPLEFLATRILALQQSTEPRHARQVRSDAKASCLLLLLCHGEQDRQIVETFQALTAQETASSLVMRSAHSNEAGTIPFASVLDAFSVPAFFILLHGILETPNRSGDTNDATEFELLQKISSTYLNSTVRLQPNSYHRKVARIFDQLLSTIGVIKNNPRHPRSMISAGAGQLQGLGLPLRSATSALPAASVADMMLCTPPPPMPGLTLQAVDFSTVNPALPPGDLSNFSLHPTPPSSISLAWDAWQMPSPLGPNSPSAMPSSADGNDPSKSTSDLLAHLLSPSPFTTDSAALSKPWAPSPPDPTTARKRRRTFDMPDCPM